MRGHPGAGQDLKNSRPGSPASSIAERAILASAMSTSSPPRSRVWARRPPRRSSVSHLSSLKRGTLALAALISSIAPSEGRPPSSRPRNSSRIAPRSTRNSGSRPPRPAASRTPSRSPSVSHQAKSRSGVARRSSLSSSRSSSVLARSTANGSPIKENVVVSSTT